MGLSIYTAVYIRIHMILIAIVNLSSPVSNPFKAKFKGLQTKMTDFCVCIVYKIRYA